MNDAPSGFRIEQALAAWNSARTRLLQDDPSLERDEAALTELLGPVEGDVDSIIARLLRAARHAKVMADGSSDLIKEMQERKTRYAARSEALRATAFAIMDAIGRTKVELPDLTATMRAGQPKVLFTNEDAIPDIYVRIERKPDVATILSALKSGLTVDGAELSNSGPSLMIRTK